MAAQYRVTYTRRAKNDLNHILRYTLSVSSKEAVLSVRQKILDAIEQIARMPGRRAVYDIHNGIKLRSYEVNKQYRIIYSIEEKPDQEVFLIRIAHVRMKKATLMASLEQE